MCITVGTILVYWAASLAEGQACLCLSQVGKMSLFNAWYTKSSTFDEFEVAQNQTIDQSGNGLRDNWVTAIQLAFKSSFKDVGELRHASRIATWCPYLRSHTLGSYAQPTFTRFANCNPA